MARENKSQTAEPSFRSRVGLERVADLDREPDAQDDGDAIELTARRTEDAERAERTSEVVPRAASGDGTPSMLGSLRRIFGDVRAKAESFVHGHGLEGVSLDDRDERIDTREPPVDVIPEGLSPAGTVDAERADPELGHASSGRSGSRQAVKRANAKQTGATVRGAASSGEQRGATTGPRKATRVAGERSQGTDKPGIRRGSSRSKSSHRAH